MNCAHDDCKRPVAREDGQNLFADKDGTAYCSPGCQQDQNARKHEAANRPDLYARAADYKAGRG